MPQFPWLNPDSFFFPAGPLGCLLIHGFTGSPPEMRPMGEYLAQRNITVNGPRLAGHGTSPQDMAATTWQDWYASVETAYQELSQRCEKVFAGGFSMGALLALHLAAQRDVAGLILMSPALELRDWRTKLVPLLRFFVKFVAKDLEAARQDLTDPEAYNRFWSYDVYPTASVFQLLRLQRLVRSELGRIHCPTLVVYSSGDMSIGPQSGSRTYHGVASSDKEVLVLHNSGHGIVVDSECQVVFQKAYEWIMTH